MAQTAEFFSFGTNDLTQTTFGFSRDDAEGKFIPAYIENKIIADNPFAILDREGVGQLMKIAVEKARSVRPGMMIGIRLRTGQWKFKLFLRRFLPLFHQHCFYQCRHLYSRAHDLDRAGEMFERASLDRKSVV